MPKCSFPPCPWCVFYWGHHCCEKLSPLFCVEPDLIWNLWLLLLHRFGDLSWVICQKAVSFSEIKGQLYIQKVSWKIFPFKMWNAVDQLIGVILPVFVRKIFSSHEDLKFSRIWEHRIFESVSWLLCMHLLLFENAIQNFYYISSAPMLQATELYHRKNK